MRVLLIEEKIAARQRTRDLIAEVLGEGVEVVEAAGQVQAVEALEAARVDVLLLVGVPAADLLRALQEALGGSPAVLAVCGQLPEGWQTEFARLGVALAVPGDELAVRTLVGLLPQLASWRRQLEQQWQKRDPAAPVVEALEQASQAQADLFKRTWEKLDALQEASQAPAPGLLTRGWALWSAVPDKGRTALLGGAAAAGGAILSRAPDLLNLMLTWSVS